MGWSLGYDSRWRRDIGYGVPAVCDHPDCNKEIDRGLSYVCGGEPYGGDDGCGLFFCDEHLAYFFTKGCGDGISTQLCEQCGCQEDPFDPKPDSILWKYFKLTDESWAGWRAENGSTVALMQIEIDKLSSEQIEQIKKALA